MIQLLCRFSGCSASFLSDSRPAIDLLAAQPTCRRLTLARSTEIAGRWVLTAEFESFSDYRAALSPFDVRTCVIPFLSTADQDGSAVLEVAAVSDGGAVRELPTVVDPSVLG